MQTKNMREIDLFHWTTMHITLFSIYISNQSIKKPGVVIFLLFLLVSHDVTNFPFSLVFVGTFMFFILLLRTECVNKQKRLLRHYSYLQISAQIEWVWVVYCNCNIKKKKQFGIFAHTIGAWGQQSSVCAVSFRLRVFFSVYYFFCSYPIFLHCLSTFSALLASFRFEHFCVRGRAERPEPPHELSSDPKT